MDNPRIKTHRVRTESLGLKITIYMHELEFRIKKERFGTRLCTGSWPNSVPCSSSLLLDPRWERLGEDSPWMRVRVREWSYEKRGEMNKRFGLYTKRGNGWMDWDLDKCPGDDLNDPTVRIEPRVWDMDRTQDLIQRSRSSQEIKNENPRSGIDGGSRDEINDQDYTGMRRSQDQFHWSVLNPRLG